MTAGQARSGWEQRVEEATAGAEAEVRRAIAAFNDEVVPAVRREGSRLLQAAAGELRLLADWMERHGRAAASGSSGRP